MRALSGFIAFVYLSGGLAHATPDGAPWGAADPDAMQNCASCHYDQEPVLASKAISLSGLPENFSPGAAYFVVLTFAGKEGAKAGFLITASAGKFSAGGGFLVANGAEIRSVRPKNADGETKWHMMWHAPDESKKTMTFYIAVNAGNDDQSSFGDVIHFKTVDVSAD